MFRRSRFSVRPNVGTVGRTTGGTSQEPAVTNQQASEKPKEATESKDAPAVTDKSDVTPSENISASVDGNDQNEEGTSSSASVQRRKRFSIKPKVVPGRPPTLSRTPKSPVKAAVATPAEVSGSNTEKLSTSTKATTTADLRGLQSPRRRRLSEESVQPKVQPKLIPSSPDTSGTVIAPAENVSELTHLPADSTKQAETVSGSQVKGAPSRPPERVPPSLPDKETTEISEKAKTLISKNAVSVTQSTLSLSRLLNDPSDVQRMIKSQKLRDLLKQERCKEKNLKKVKTFQKEFSLDPTKMTMRDLIHYIPVSNPMTLEDVAQENETVIPPSSSASPRREKSPERTPQADVLPPTTSSREEEEGGDAEEEQDEAMMVPQVKVAEDGSLIIDEESLTVEVQRAKGPNPAQDREPIFERGSTTTYSSFRKSYYTKPWSIEETDMFFLAVSMVGTDFSMICQLFPHRTRSEIKNKFKREERENSWRVDKAFRERRQLDIEYFSKLLEKVMEVQKDRKKLKSLAKKNATNKLKSKAKRKRTAKKLSDVEEEDDDQILELEDRGEKENEDQFNEGGNPASEPKKRPKRKKRTESLAQEPNEKKTKSGVQAENSEAALTEDQTHLEVPEKDTVTKPARRGRAPKPLLPLGLKQAKKALPSRKDIETASNKGAKSTSDETSKEQVNEEESDLSCANRTKSDGDQISSEDEAVVKPQQPTRYGRVPKPIQPLTYSSKEVPHASDSETTPAKSKRVVKRRKSATLQSTQKLKKPKLVTIRSSKTDFSDDESENEFEDRREDGCSSSRDAEACMFAPSSLHPTNTVVSEVDETMVELDILDSMPDVLGIQDALGPDSSYDNVQHETGTAELCEHQLDLLVDVIDFLSAEHTEDSPDESYNEAAQTLLTIGNMTHVSQTAQSEMTTEDGKTEEATDGINASRHPEGDIVPSAQSRERDNDDLSQFETSNQTRGELKTVCDTDPAPQATSNPESPPKTRRFSKVKPKPTLGQTLRTAKPTSQKKTPEEQKIEGNETTTAEEVSPETTDSTPSFLKDNISSTKVKSSETISVNSSITQTHSLSAPQFEPSRNQSTTDTKTPDSRDEGFIHHGETIDGETSNAAVTEGREPATLSDPIQENSNIHPPCTLPAENLPVSQKGEGEVATSSQPKGNRLPKIKPKPNLTQTPRVARNKSQVSEETVEKGSLSALKPECLAQTETSSLHFKGATQIKAHGQCATQAVLDVTTSDQRAMENQGFSKVQLIGEQTTRLTSQLAEENLTPEFGTTDPAVTEPYVPQRSSVDLAETREQSDNPVTFNAPVEEITVDKEDHKVASAHQSRRSRTQKLKPKPNIPQISRTARSKCETTVEPAERDSRPSVNFSENKGAKVEQNSTSTSDKQTESSKSASGIKPPLTSASYVTPSVENQTFVGPDHTNKEAASYQSVIENQNLSDLQFELVEKQTTDDKGFNSELTDKNLISPVETIESRCSNTVDSGGTEVGPELNLDSASVEEPSGLPMMFVKPVEESKVCEQDLQVSSTCKLRRSRLKITPKLNVPQRSVEFKPEISEEPTEKDSTSSPNLESHKTTVTKVEPTCNPQPEIQSQERSKVQLEPYREQVTKDEDKSSEFKDGQESNPTSDRSGQPPSSEELLLNQEKEEVASASPLRSRRSQKMKPKPNLSQISRIARFKPRVANQALGKDSSCTPTLENKTKAVVETQPSFPEKESENTDGEGTLKTPDQSASENQNLSEVQPEQSMEQDTTWVKTSSKFRDTDLMSYVETSEICSDKAETIDLGFKDLQVRSAVDSASVQDQSDHRPALVISAGRLPVSELQEEIDVVTSKPELSQDHFSVMQPPSPALSSISSDKTKAEEAEPSCSTCLPDKLNQNKTTGASPVSEQLLEAVHKCTEESPTFEEQQMPNVGQVADSEDAKQTIPQRRQRFPKVKPKPNLGPTSKITRRKPLADDGSKPLKVQLMDSPSFVTSEQQLKDSTKDMIKDDGVETDLASSGDGVVEMSKTQTVTDQTETTDDQCTRKETASTANFITLETDSSGQSSDQMSSKLTESKAPQTQRGRLIKPKPNLQRSSRPQQPQQVHKTKPTKADSSSCSQGVDVSVDLKSESELRLENQEPKGGIIDKLSHKDSSSNYACSSLGFVTQETTTQNESTSSSEGIHSYPLISEILPTEVPSDPDEPFFILSLTEIPVSSVREGVDSAPEHLPDPPVTDSSADRPSVSLEAAGYGFVSTKENSVGLVGTGGESASAHADQQGRENTAVQSPKVPETVKSNETETPTSTQTIKGSGGKGKLQVKSKASGKKQTASAATETKSESASFQSSTVQDADRPECSEQPKSSASIITEPHGGSGEHADTDKTPTGGEEADSSVASQAAQNIRSTRQSKKAKDCSAFSSETNVSSASKPPSRKVTSKKMKSPSEASKKSPSEPKASTSKDVPTPRTSRPSRKVCLKSVTPPDVDITQTSHQSSSHSAPSSHLHTAEASSNDDGSEATFVDEEPTSMSQYFLSDIFTEVEEG
ncbi:transcription factor TFIIIB component B'' homolog [Austrofundulus limnaeus]|uniref:Transcription factor TFIIIB component B'' homolog n=1 Tax=Austrofundulus limnaeus TaxID=52670 RepID=A0A2I4CZA6_AUSLI|nr:PREDICTED: transcription factor TFIIIB component B'' homolog [Austrofundulus limnaeus]